MAKERKSVFLSNVKNKQKSKMLSTAEKKKASLDWAVMERLDVT